MLSVPSAGGLLLGLADAAGRLVVGEDRDEHEQRDDQNDHLLGNAVGNLGSDLAGNLRVALLLLLRVTYPVLYATDLDMFRTQVWLTGTYACVLLGFAALFPFAERMKTCFNPSAAASAHSADQLHKDLQVFQARALHIERELQRTKVAYTHHLNRHVIAQSELEDAQEVRRARSLAFSAAR